MRSFNNGFWPRERVNVLICIELDVIQKETNQNSVNLKKWKQKIRSRMFNSKFELRVVQ